MSITQEAIYYGCFGESEQDCAELPLINQKKAFSGIEKSNSPIRRVSIFSKK